MRLKAVKKIGRAIERVDNPPVLRIARVALIALLLLKWSDRVGIEQRPMIASSAAPSTSLT